MRTSNTDHGFTLIELLVVIGIIGVLSSIILSSLTTARNKSIDAQAIANLDNSRSQSQLFYDANGNRFVQSSGTVSDICNINAAQGGSKGVYSFLQSAAQTESVQNIAYNTSGAANTAVCNSTGNGWAMEIPLKNGHYYCVDSNGIASSSQNLLILVNSIDVDCSN
jgi:prepilin-type N-terminal cleavage/methylation domain-containing protein